MTQHKFIISRDELYSVLEKSIKNDDLLVVGMPGVGKTYSMELMAQKFIDDGYEVFYLEADKYISSTIVEFNENIKIKGEFHEALNELENEKQAFLFVDGLDAARNEQSQKVFREILRNVKKNCNNWRIIAGVRTYDLLNSLELRRIFPRNDDSKNRFKLNKIKQNHILIPPLSDLELQSVVAQYNYLRNIIDNSTIEFKELLGIPRNLEFVVKLKDDGYDIYQLTRIQSEVELLSSIWDHYILDSEIKRAIIKNIIMLMINKNNMVLDRNELIGSIAHDYTKELQELINSEIVVPVYRRSDNIKFANHTYYDYAVSQHIIDDETIESFILDNSKSIYYRPSIRYFMTYQWYHNREGLWETVVKYNRLKSLNISNIVLPYVTIVEESREITEMAPLYDILVNNNESNIMKYYLLSLNHYLKNNTPHNKYWVPLLLYNWRNYLSDKVWLYYVEILRRFEKDEYFNNLRSNKEYYHAFSKIIRYIISWGWERRNNNIISGNSRALLKLVIKTYDYNKNETSELLRNILNKIGVTETPIDEMLYLCDSINGIVNNDVELAIDVYGKIFEYEEKSDEKTPMGGYVLSLISTRKQDYKLCQYRLKEYFRHFLDTNPQGAVKALIKSLGEYIRIKESKYVNNLEKEVEENGIRYISDFSYIWDSDRQYEDDAQSMLSIFQDWLSAIDDDKIIREVFNTLKKENNLAAIWRRVLFSIKNNPRNLIILASELLITKLMYVGSETRDPSTQSLEVVYPLLDEFKRKEIEEMIISLHEYNASWHYKNELMNEILPKLQAGLIFVLDEKSIVTDEIKSKKNELSKQGELKKLEPLYERGGFYTRPYSTGEWLKDEGVKIEDLNNKNLLELNDHIEEINEKLRNEKLTIKSIEGYEGIINNAWNTYNELKGIVDSRVRVRMLTSLAEFADNSMRIKELKIDDGFGKLLYEILRVAAEDQYPLIQPDKEYENRFMSWSPAPRIEAAQGLMKIVYYKKIKSVEIKNIIYKLATDEVLEVRFQIINTLNYLLSYDKKLYWKVVNDIVTNEKSTLIIVPLLNNLGYLIGDANQYNRITKDVLSIVKRFEQKDVNEDIFKNAYSILTVIYIKYNDNDSKSALVDLLDDGIDVANIANSIIRNTFSFLLVGIKKEINSFNDTDEVRNRAMLIIEYVLSYIEKIFNSFRNSKNTKYEDEKIRNIYHLVDVIGDSFAFNIDFGQERKIDDSDKLTESERKEYFKEIFIPIINKYLDVCHPDNGGGLPAETAHRLFELSRYLLYIDFHNTMRFVNKLIGICEPGGYIYDRFSIDELKKFVDLCLADFRHVLREDTESLDILSDILDQFIGVGWPDAVDLVLRLDRVFR